MSKAEHFNFGKILLQWHRKINNRSLPWKNIEDVYKIWLSEILLQQTRAEQAAPYYYSFIENYPDIFTLASASDEEVFKIWQGLGYYNRCKNMLATARLIVQTYNGVFPGSCLELLKLKGIGPYTAAAIASFAYNEDVAVLDGNVYRVLSRVFSIDLAIDSSLGKKHFNQLANELLVHGNAKEYNQAIMDFGATICTPKSPDCLNCPFKSNCKALLGGLIKDLPIKSKKIKVRERHFHYLWIHDKNAVYLQQRSEKDIWPLLWEPFLIEQQNNFLPREYVDRYQPELLFQSKQRLTHQLIYSYFYDIKITRNQLRQLKLLKVDYQLLTTLSFSKTCLDFIKNYYTFI